MIYLDSHATTPVDPRVLEAMLPYFTEQFGNASSRNHPLGWTASRAVERAREQVAALIGARHREIVFTSGATESNNLAIKGVAACAPAGRRQIVTLVTEHRAVLDSCRALEKQGFTVTWLPVESDGLVDLDRFTRAVSDQTLLVSVMAGNNEIGVIQPLRELAQIARSRGALFHCDAVQAAGVVQVDAPSLGIDLLSLSAHKMYGPKGVGALYVARRRPPIPVSPLLDGGGHERGYRSGTLNVPAIAGFGLAAELCRRAQPAEAVRLGALRDRLWAGLRGIPGLRMNGSAQKRLPQNLNVHIEDVPGETLLRDLSAGVALSSGAACATVSSEPSHVLRAIGLSDEQARASLRFGFHRFNTDQEVEQVVSMVATSVACLRSRAS